MLAATLAMVGMTAQAQIPAGYYDSLKGKKGAELKTAIHEIIKNATVLEYGSGRGATWWGFYTTDNDNGSVIDRYSNNTWTFGSQGSSVSGMNIEHSFPKSWWGGAKTQAYMDLFNLMPSDEKANSSKSNYGMGVVKTSKYDNGCIKVGKGTEGFYVWQPAEKWEGDFARGFMYMATAYQDYTWTNAEGLNTLVQGDYPTLKEWAYKLYIEWAKADGVDDIEVKRNAAVYKIQGNRNPYVDFPNLMEYVWGDSVDYAFDPATTIRSAEFSTGGDDDTQPSAVTIYTANYKSSNGNCTIESIQDPTASVSVWTRSSRYGWTGTSSVKSGSTYIKYNAEGYLLTPEIDLTGYATATLSFSHIVNFSTSPATYLSVEVRCDGETTVLDGINWPAGSDWKAVDSGEISLDQFAGKKIQIVFHYRGTTSVSPTWEVQDIAVTGTKETSGISQVSIQSGFDPSKPYDIFDINGRKLQDIPSRKGIVILRQDGKSWKRMQ